MPEHFVTSAPLRPTDASFASDDLLTALAHLRRHSARGSGRLALWIDAEPPLSGPEVVVVLPLAVLDEWEARAAEVVDGWDERWLLIASADRRHRAEARAALVDEVVVALLVAAMGGIDDAGASSDADPAP